MIVVSVQLWSARTGRKTELARMEICNDETGTKSLRNYIARTLRGRCTTALDRRTTHRQTRITRWPSERVHVFNLVAACLKRMAYGATSAHIGGETDDLFEGDVKDEVAQ